MSHAQVMPYTMPRKAAWNSVMAATHLHPHTASQYL